MSEYMPLCVFVCDCASKCLHLKGVALITQLLLFQASPLPLPHNTSMVAEEEEREGERECVGQAREGGGAGWEVM